MTGSGKVTAYGVGVWGPGLQRGFVGVLGPIAHVVVDEQNVENGEDGGAVS